MKDQTDSETKDKLGYILAIAKIDYAKDEKPLLIIEGKIDLDKGLSQNVKHITKAELVTKKKEG